VNNFIASEPKNVGMTYKSHSTSTIIVPIDTAYNFIRLAVC